MSNFGRGPGLDEPAEPGGDEAVIAALGDELLRDRPLPSPVVRSRIRTLIAAASPLRPRPPHLRGLVAAYSAAGLLLLVVGVLGLAGVGPLGT